jgi:hypothetical protein
MQHSGAQVEAHGNLKILITVLVTNSDFEEHKRSLFTGLTIGSNAFWGVPRAKMKIEGKGARLRFGSYVTKTSQETSHISRIVSRGNHIIV